MNAGLSFTDKLNKSTAAVDEDLEKRKIRLAQRAEAADAVLPPETASAESKPPEKQKVVRGTFSMLPSDFELIDDLRRAIRRSDGDNLKKSEILRAGLYVLRSMTDEERRAAADAVEIIKTGRPG